MYETDALAWSEQQADLLRRLAAGERVRDAIDWPNVIADVQDVGLSQLRSCRSLLRQAIIHLLKMRAWPESDASAHWQNEAENFLFDAKEAFSPSMRPRIDLDAQYAEALRRDRKTLDDSGAPQALPDICPFTVDDVLAGDLASLLSLLR